MKTSDLKTYFEHGLEACNALLMIEAQLKQTESVRREIDQLKKEHAVYLTNNAQLKKDCADQQAQLSQWREEYRAFKTLAEREARVRELDVMIAEKTNLVKVLTHNIGEIQTRVAQMG